MKHIMHVYDLRSSKISFTICLSLVAVFLCGIGDTSAQTQVSPSVRRDLLQTRERTWRAFFENDPATLDQLLGPELIAIQESQERWENRVRLVEMAIRIKKQGIRILRLEFPQTEIQVFGKTAILYYTYVFETGSSDQPSAVNSGRGTEVFVLRKGKWVDVGWHLDNGAFRFRNGMWSKVG